MSFRYSVGDFIAVAGLIHNVIIKLKETGGARTIYQELCADLEGLNTTLRQVQSLEHESGRVAGLWEACGACLEKVHGFLKTLDKYQSTLRHETPGGWVHELRKLVHKIDFGVLKEDQVKDFRSSLAIPLQRAQLALQTLVARQGNDVRGTQHQHSEYLAEILRILKISLPNELSQPPAYEEHSWEERRSSLLPASLPTTEKIDNVLKDLQMIGKRFADSQGDDIDNQVVNVIKQASAACESLQKEGEILKSSELSKVLEMLAGILGKYDEGTFRNFPSETKRQVVYAMGLSLESSLDFTDKVIALLQEHQRESDRKGGNTVGDPQMYHRVSQCITSLAQAASQFDGFVTRPDPETKPWPYDDFESKTPALSRKSTASTFIPPTFSRQSTISSFNTDFEGRGTSIKYIEDLTPRSLYSDKFEKGFGVAVEEIRTNSLDESDLLSACQERDIDLLEALLKKPGVGVNVIDDKGNGVLHLTLGTGKVNADKSKMTNIVNIVRLLCTHGANVNAPDRSGLCPVHYCAQTINSEAAKYLLDKGARINELDSKGRTALHYAAVDGHPDVEFVKMLVGKGGKLGTAKLPKLPPKANENQKKARLLVIKK